MNRCYMFDDINEKNVLITGATGGIGVAMAKLFSAYGANLGLHFNRSKDAAEKLLSEIRAKQGKAELLQGDLLDPKVRTGLVGSFINIFGGIDVLINNAGTAYGYGHFSKLDTQSWDNTFDLNLKAPFCLIQDAFEYMKNNGGGRIINITTVSVKYGGSPNNLHYVASKAALDSMTIGLAREGAKNNILVNSIRCGIIDTPMRDNIDGYTEKRFKERVSLVPLGRAGKPDDIAGMAIFLASESGNFITGQNFAVSGGD